ncbi:Uma2 family endonuclease [Planomonospora sp. ID82291]|uniref:Uma2 family endonuclease n=1 Tax=Planomonospora sp. ID82291 TaxID=2738136 RepID=UPI0027DD2AFB|nr:Uma2 family endonuclease [Planomonospora sp. ID82291]
MVMSLPRYQTTHQPCARRDAPHRPWPGTVDDQTLRLCEELNEGGYSAEIVREQVIVSPWTSRRNDKIIDRLTDLLYQLKREMGWALYQSSGIHIPPFRDMRLPDLIVAPLDAEDYDEMHIYGHSTLLVVEVCSGGTASVDYREKPTEYARAGVPLYLIVDPTAEPPKVTLMSEPVEDPAPFDEREPYLKTVTVHSGGSLELPEPFGLRIDVAALFA